MTVSIQQYAGLLTRYLSTQKLNFFILAFSLLSGIGLDLLSPQIVKYFIDAAIGGETTQALMMAAAFFIGVVALRQLVSVATAYFSEVVGWSSTNALRRDLVRHCLYLDMSFHQQHTPGALIERIDGDPTVLRNFFSQFVIQIVGNILLALGILGLMFWVDWRIGLALTVFTITALIVLNSVRDISVPYWSATRQAHAELFGYLEERLAGIEDIRANGAVSYTILLFLQRARIVLYASLKSYSMMIVSLSAGIGLFTIGHIISFSLGLYLFSRGSLTIGTLYLIFNYTELLRKPIETIIDQIEDLQSATGSLIRIQDIFNTKNQLRQNAVIASDRSAVRSNSSAQGRDIVFDGVSFGYEEDQMILKDINFHLEAGKVLGLLGHTGSGKTTITRLLFRLYDPSQGQILLDGAALSTIPLPELRREIGLVTQDVQIFQASVRDNLTIFDPNISDDQIFSILDELELNRWINALADGLDTQLESGGGSLSAGQAQLLALARVLLKTPRLVILDEASSRLDAVTEQILQKTIDKLLQQCTAIVIAHRLATVRRVDEIIILEQGEILECGSREQLENEPNSRLSHLLKVGFEEAAK